jgi:hypothetical protein
MSKKFCRDRKELAKKIKGKELTYECAKCDQQSPKEKWCCKPKEIKR